MSCFRYLIDGWPIIGTVLPDTIGSMSWGERCLSKITTGLTCNEAMISIMLLSQSSGNGITSLGWRCSHWWRKGWLRLKAFKPLVENELLQAEIR